MTVVRLVNQVRRRHGLRLLRVNRRLAAVASRWREGHHLLAQRLRRAKVPYRRASENLAWGPKMTPQAAVTAWLESPPHRANLLDPNVSGTGVAISEEGGLLYYAQDFAG